MGMSALIIDRRLGRGETARGESISALLAPTPHGSVAAALVEQLHACDILDVFVLTERAADSEYAARIAECAAGAVLLDGAALAQRLSRAEPTDGWLIVEARHVAPRENIYRVLTHGGVRDVVAVHLVALADRNDRALETVVLDGRGALTRFERIFPGVTHFHGPMVAATLTSAAALRNAPSDSIGDLSRLRTTLAERGVPSRDVPLTGQCIDILDRDGLLELCEHLSGQRSRNGDRPEWATAEADVWKSPRARVHPSSRLVGPVTVLDDAVVGSGALIVGPAVVGARARIEPQCVLARSVVLNGAVVKSGSSVVGEVFAGARTNGDRDATRPSPSCGGSRQLPPVVTEHRSPMGPIGQAAKRAFDIVLSAVGLAVLSPLLLLVAVAVKLTSSGPVFFAHEREGRGGRPFRCVKFRTMMQRAHSMQRRLYEVSNVDGPQFKMDNDPRVTWLGHYLRRTNIDELPQLLNVLVGDMSLIGPRPSPFRENQLCMPWRATRLSVRPGVTGLWQICRNERQYGDFHQWIYYDIQYVQSQSLLLDLKILLATALTCGGRWSVPDRWMLESAARTRQGSHVHRRSVVRASASASPERRGVAAARSGGAAVAWANAGPDAGHEIG